MSRAFGRANTDKMMYSDSSRLGTPFAKDPSVAKFKGSYYLYYSIPRTEHIGWSVGIAKSNDLINWEKVGELLPTEKGPDARGLAAPCAIVIDGKLHLFYQSYTGGRDDAICHAISDDGIHFSKNITNPIAKPHGQWSVGRAIDADVINFKGKYFLYYATRDPQMKIQMLAAACVDVGAGFDRDKWQDLSPEGTMFKPELPWERDCIEAPSACVRDGKVFLFYAGAYNCAPQQIGVAVSDDGIHFTRLSDKPLLTNGKAGEWNSSESGHPGIFVDDDGETYLFYQGSNDKGKTWFLSQVQITWKDNKPEISR